MAIPYLETRDMSLTELRRKGEGPVRKEEGPVCVSSDWQVSDTPSDTILALIGSVRAVGGAK